MAEEGLRLSAFADEISPDLEEQIRVLTELRIGGLDLRSVGGRNVLELTEEELAAVARRLARAGIRVEAVGSPLGKVPVQQPFAEERARFERAVRAAHALGTRVIRVFSFYLDPAERDRWHEEIVRRFRELTARAAAEGLTLVHENERGIYGQTAAACRRLLEEVDSPALRQAYDPANFLWCGEEAYPAAFRELAPYIAYVHVKDARRGQPGALPAGEGEGRIGEAIAELWAGGYRGVLALEPHLGGAGEPGGGAAGMRRAAAALRRVLAAAGVPEAGWEPPRA